jgi:hypothetical protein
MHVVMRETPYQLQFCSLLQDDDKIEEMVRKASRVLETTTPGLFITHGWKYNIRLCQA